MADQGWRERLKAGRDRAVAVVGGSGMVAVTLLAFRPWEPMITAAVKGAERLPEPLASLVTAAACKAHRWSGELPTLTSAGAARNALPEVCQTDLDARLGSLTMEFATRGAIGASALVVLAAGGRVYRHLNRPADPAFLTPTPMSVDQALRPGPHHRDGLPGLVARTVMRPASRSWVSPARA